MPLVVGGRYGLSSKDFNPSMAKAVFDELAGPKEMWIRENNFHKSRNDYDLGGAQIETPFALQLDSLHDFRISLGERSVVVKGRIAHCHIGELKEGVVLYRTGVEFIEISDHAQEAIGRVRAIHQRITGTAPDGRPYAAADPHLLTWVHIAEADSFLRAHSRFGVQPLDQAGGEKGADAERGPDCADQTPQPNLGADQRPVGRPAEPADDAAAHIVQRLRFAPGGAVLVGVEAQILQARKPCDQR